MPRGQLNKDLIRAEVLKLKHELDCENITYSSDPKSLAHRYLSKVLDKIEEYYH